MWSSFSFRLTHVLHSHWLKLSGDWLSFFMPNWQVCLIMSLYCPHIAIVDRQSNMHLGPFKGFCQ